MTQDEKDRQRLSELGQEAALESLEAEIELKKDENAGRPEPLALLVDRQSTTGAQTTNDTTKKKKEEEMKDKDEKPKTVIHHALMGDPGPGLEQGQDKESTIQVDPTLLGGKNPTDKGQTTKTSSKTKDPHSKPKGEDKDKKKEEDPEKTERDRPEKPAKDGMGLWGIVGIVLFVLLAVVVATLAIIKASKNDGDNPTNPTKASIVTNLDLPDASPDAEEAPTDTAQTVAAEDTKSEDGGSVDEVKVELMIKKDGILSEDSTCSNEAPFTYDASVKSATCGQFQCWTGVMEAWRSAERKALGDGKQMTMEVVCALIEEKEDAPDVKKEDAPPVVEPDPEPTKLLIEFTKDGIITKDAICAGVPDDVTTKLEYDASKKIANCGSVSCYDPLMEVWRSDKRKALKEGESLTEVIICAEASTAESTTDEAKKGSEEEGAPKNVKASPSSVRLTIRFERNGIVADKAICSNVPEELLAKLEYDADKKIAKCGSVSCWEPLMAEWKASKADRAALEEGKTMTKFIECGMP